MPHTIAFDAADKRIVVTVTSPVTHQDALRCLREMRMHPEFRSDYGLLFNMLEADTSGYPNASEAVQFGELVKVFFTGQKLAVVASHALTTEWGFMSVTAAPSAALRLFPTLNEASAWLAN